MKLYQTTIKIYTDTDPSAMDIDVLTHEVMWGGAYEGSRSTVQVEVSDKDIVDFFDPDSWKSE